MSNYATRQVDPHDILTMRAALVARYRYETKGTGGGDADEMACHVGAFRDEALVGIGSIHPEPMPGGFRTGTWQLHDVAIEHGHRGLGVGALIMERLLEHAVEANPRAVWCLSPVGACGFFERFGFQRSGDPLDGPSGPGYLLFVELGPLHRSWTPTSESD